MYPNILYSEYFHLLEEILIESILPNTDKCALLGNTKKNFLKNLIKIYSLK